MHFARLVLLTNIPVEITDTSSALEWDYCMVLLLEADCGFFWWIILSDTFPKNDYQMYNYPALILQEIFG